MRWLLAALILLALGLAGWGAVNMGGGTPPAVGGGGPTTTIFDGFSTDTEAEYDVWDGANDCDVDNVTNQQMDMNGSGVCHPDEANTPPGTQPTSADQWAIIRTPGSGAPENRGPTLRYRDDGSEATGSDNNYVLRCSGDILILRTCEDGDGCSTFFDSGTSCGTRIDDVYGFAVAGTDDSTEFCFWFWESGGPTINASNTPNDWGKAPTECVSDDGNIVQSSLTDLDDGVDPDCGGDTTCTTWGTNQGQGPGEQSLGGYTSDTHVGIYSGSSGEGSWVEWAAGDL